MRIKTKLLFVVVPLIVAPLLTLGWIAYKQTRERSTDLHRVESLILSRVTGDPFRFPNADDDEEQDR